MSEQQTQRQESPLRTERGSTRIEDSVVAKVAGIAAQEVEGIQMGGGTAWAVGGFLESVPGYRPIAGFISDLCLRQF